MPGWGPFVKELEYQKYITNYVDEPEVSTLIFSFKNYNMKLMPRSIQVRLNIMPLSGLRYDVHLDMWPLLWPWWSVHYTLSYEGMVPVTFRKVKHKFINLFLWNHSTTNYLVFRYSYMNFLIFAMLFFIILPWILITYNISCQWLKNFVSCMSNFPDHMQINPETRINVAIPSWHINHDGHGQRCRKDLYTRGCRGEVETTWSSTNALAPSLREMAPWARHDTLNDHWNFHNILAFHMCFILIIVYHKSHSTIII